MSFMLAILFIIRCLLHVCGSDHIATQLAVVLVLVGATIVVPHVHCENKVR